MQQAKTQQAEPLPSHYPYVADDILALCKAAPGVWLDVGAGPGGVGLALAERAPGSVVILMDPSPDALSKALAAASAKGLWGRVAALKGNAEQMPLPDACVDLVVSRGSIFFWQNPGQGIREARRVLRPGGQAMIGGGLGRGYPAWARQEFIRRRRESQRRKGSEAMRKFREVRSRDTFECWAREAGLTRFEVRGEGGLDEGHRDAGVGLWLLFSKEASEPIVFGTTSAPPRRP